ncbi:MAG TPA: serine protease [Vitreimonas sp.]|uniref:S1 family peptidase n=1 Tax=Vitreimonas sp. TaxID=3069702 RepID=UPI002D5DA7AB|nr:serine protease [Vitreimonas sp.]HYD89776.1 serine protease [Vitreimonas sp.]
MLRLVPDWLLYIIVIAAVVFVLFRVDQRADAPEVYRPDSAQPEPGAFLPPPSMYDPEVLVEVGPVASGMGSAFAISEEGWWLTARHVVDGCQQVGLIVSRGAAVPVQEVKRALFADLALLRTERAPAALALDTSERQFQVGQRAFHVGFPQGRPGEAYSRLIGRETLVARGRYDLEEPVLAWAELGRTTGLRGSLAGISGGPAFGANGQVIGVTIAESARRGRVYTASPSSITRLLRLEQVDAQGAPAPRLTADNYGEESDDLRRQLAVAQVVCVAPGDRPL